MSEESSLNFLRKMSVKTLCGKVKKPEKLTWLARVYGVATDVKVGSTALGEYEALIGTFEGINIESGETFQSGTLFLPPPADGIIIGKVREFLKKEGAEPVQFAVEIGVQPDAGTPDRPNNYGYQYVARPLIKTAESTMLAALRDDVNKAIKSLEHKAK